MTASVRILVAAGLIAFGLTTSAALATEAVSTTSGDFDFGDNDSSYAMNGSCEDPRFTGEGMSADLSEDAYMHDAKDCMTLFAEGEIDITEEERSLHPEGPLDILDILAKISKGGGKATEIE